MPSESVVLGAVAYDPKVVTIWEGFKAWFARHGLEFDYVLYSNYERLVEDLLAGRIDAAWNSPLAWVRARRVAESTGRRAEAIAMRDTDCDLSSVIVVRSGAGVDKPDDLRGKTVGVGAVDSPQATLLPLSHLRDIGLEPGADVTIRYFDVLAGKHGDHIGGEREAARALVAGEVDAACMIDGNHLLFSREGTLAAGATTVLSQTGPYDHCNFTVLAPLGPGVERFRELLLGMSFEDAELRPLLELEGLRGWRPGRTEGYAPLERAVDEAGFYDGRGAITATGYRY